MSLHLQIIAYVFNDRQFYLGVHKKLTLVSDESVWDGNIFNGHSSPFCTKVRRKHRKLVCLN